MGTMVLPYVTVLVGTKAAGPETTPPPQQLADLAVDADATAAGAMTAMPTHAEVMRRRRIILCSPRKETAAVTGIGIFRLHAATQRNRRRLSIDTSSIGARMVRKRQ